MDKLPSLGRNKELNALALFGAALLLSGCVLSYPTDLQIVSLTAVKRDDIPGAKPLNLKDAQYPMLKVSFVSDANLIAYTVDSYGISAAAHFCNKTDQIPSFVGSPTPNLAWGEVFSGEFNIGDTLFKSGQMFNVAHRDLSIPRPTEASQPFQGNLYSVYLFTYRTRPPPGPWSHPEQGWDLIHNPHDVCLRVGVHKDYLAPRISNELVISASQLSSALR